jgi:hypothetical protein
MNPRDPCVAGAVSAASPAPAADRTSTPKYEMSRREALHWMAR